MHPVCTKLTCKKLLITMEAVQVMKHRHANVNKNAGEKEQTCIIKNY